MHTLSLNVELLGVGFRGKNVLEAGVLATSRWSKYCDWKESARKQPIDKAKDEAAIKLIVRLGKT